MATRMRGGGITGERGSDGRRRRARGPEAAAGLLLLAAAVLGIALAAPAAAQEPAPVVEPGADGSEHDCGDLGEISLLSPDEPGGSAVEPWAGAEPIRLSEAERGGLLFATGRPGEYLPAPALSAEVEIRVTGIVARARVAQRFTNPGDGWVEGIYVFPLPEDAAVDALRLVVGDRVIEGEVREREEAARVYREARDAGARASLVEQARPNLFTTRVANVGPGEEVAVEIEYQQVVAWADGAGTLRFPMVSTPRYDPGARTLPLGAIALAGLGREGRSGAGLERDALAAPAGARFTPPAWQPPAPEPPRVLPAAATLPLEVALAAQGGAAPAAQPSGPPPLNPLSIEVLLDAGVPLAWVESPHHDVVVREDGQGRWRVALAAGAVPADRDFELRWGPEAGAEPRAALFTEEIGGDLYALLMVVPPDPERAPEPPPREVIFVIDTSGSMHGASIEQAKAALIAALGRLRPIDTFNVIAFASTSRALFPGSWPALPESIDKAERWIGRLTADGSTEMLPALAAALDPPAEGYGAPGRGAVRQVVFLTDGAVANEDELFAYLEGHVGSARLFAVGIGSAPNGHLLGRAAEIGRGTFTHIGSPEQVAERVEALTRKLESPLLTDVEAVWDDPVAEVWPERAPDLYAGEPLVLAARLVAPGDGVTVRGVRDGRPWEARVPFGGGGVRPAVVAGGEGGLAAEEDAAPLGLGKLWARKKIAALTAELARGAELEPVRAAVVELALGHHLVSRWTSLVAVDVTPARPAGEPLSPRAVPVAMPHGSAPVGLLPVGGTPAPLLRVLGAGLLLFAAALAWVLRRGLTAPEPAR